MSYASVPPPHTPAQLAAGMAAARDFERRHPQPAAPDEAARINALADDYKRGLDKMVASGYEEFGINVLRNHATVIKALRAYAKLEHLAPADRWTITSRRKLSERIYWAWRLLFAWPSQPTEGG